MRSIGLTPSAGDGGLASTAIEPPQVLRFMSACDNRASGFVLQCGRGRDRNLEDRGSSTVALGGESPGRWHKDSWIPALNL